MGTQVYDGQSAKVVIEDRLLHHLALVISAKFRRGESFWFNWQNGQDNGGGRGMIWMAPHTPVYFKFDGGRTPMVNREWVELLMLAANTPHGLSAVPEPAPHS